MTSSVNQASYLKLTTSLKPREHAATPEPVSEDSRQPIIHTPRNGRNRNPAMEPDAVDKLLERYLVLLDEYTSLRSALEDLQGAMYQNIARANFSGERGVRYGQDFYDDRMRASRRVEVVVEDGVPGFSTALQELDDGGCVKGERKEGSEEEKVDGKEPEGAAAEQDGGAEREEVSGESKPSGNDPSSEKGADSEGGSESSEDEDEKKERERKRRERARDPLRWFGFITPMPLRLAQSQAIQLVETVIPRLASVDAEMKDVEIEVRRARKRRAKAEAGSARAAGGESLAGEARVSA